MEFSKNSRWLLLALAIFGGSLAVPKMTAQTTNGIGLSMASIDRLEDDGLDESGKPKKKKKKKKASKKDEKAFDWKQNVWLGSGFTLGLSSVSGASAFQIGISPMAGYKILPWLSVGPRVGISFGQQRQALSSTVTQRLNLTLYNAGLFVRARVWNLFLHAEQSWFWLREVEKGNGQRFVTKYPAQDNQYIGLGWNPTRGREFGFEGMVLVDVQAARDPNYAGLPFQYRAGFTWNF